MRPCAARALVCFACVVRGTPLNPPYAPDALLASRLERVKKQKGAALKMQHRDKRGRKKKMRAQGRVDDPGNWKSMM